MELAQHEGFDAREAGSAHEALEILEQRPDVKVVFADVRMPGELDGLALAHVIRKRWPLTVVVICSAAVEVALGVLPYAAWRHAIQAILVIGSKKTRSVPGRLACWTSISCSPART